MRDTPRFFPSDLTPGERRIYGALTLFFSLVLLALTWPVYTLFSGIRPLVLGMPFSLFYIVLVLVLSFLVLLALYWWQARRGDLDGPGAGPAGDPGEGRTQGGGGRDGEGGAGGRGGEGGAGTAGSREGA